jgi:hypothetical protein
MVLRIGAGTNINTTFARSSVRSLTIGRAWGTFANS